MASPKKRKKIGRPTHSIRTRFVAANLSMLLVTFAGLLVSQYFLAEHYKDKRISLAQEGAVVSIRNILWDGADETEIVLKKILKHKNLNVALALLKEGKQNQDEMNSIVDSYIYKTTYGVVVTDELGQTLYSSSRADRAQSGVEIEYPKRMRALRESGSQIKVLMDMDKELIEYHNIRLIRVHGEPAGVLDVIFYLDNDYAENKIFRVTQQHVAFKDAEGRPIVISSEDMRGIPVIEDGLVMIDQKGYTPYVRDVDFGTGHNIQAAIYTDVSSITEEYHTFFYYTMGLVLVVIFVALGIANHLSKRVSESMELLAEKSNVIAKGEYSARIDQKSTITEIEDIRNSFNAMTAAVQTSVSDLEDANSRLKELDSLKSSFLSSVSHELRTPLTSVLGFAKLIGKDFRKNFLPLVEGNKKLSKRANRIDGNLDIIIQEGSRLTRLINDVLDLAKIESGRMDYRDETVPVREIVQQAVQAATGQFTNKPSVALLNETADDLPDVSVDRDKLVQVIINLLNNAAKFTEQGQVSVNASLREDGWVRIAVTDTGPGIPEDDLEKVFDKFHQVQQDDTLKDKPKGTGLGLAICSQIVEHYGGRIWVESVFGEGSSFIFTLPSEVPGAREAAVPAAEARPETAAGPEPVSGPEPVPGPEPVSEPVPNRGPVSEPAPAAPELRAVETPVERPLILVIDDDPTVREQLVKVWEVEGFRVAGAPFGEQAWESVDEMLPHLATVAYRRPGLDGKTPAVTIKEDPEIGWLPVVVSSLTRDRGVAGALGGPGDASEPESAMVETLNAMIRREEEKAGSCLILKGDSASVPTPPQGLCGESVECARDELNGLLDDGFTGNVIIPPGLFTAADLMDLAGRTNIQVVLIPNLAADE